LNEIKREGFLQPPGEAGEAETMARPTTGSGVKPARAERPEPRRREPEPEAVGEPTEAPAEAPAETWPITVKLKHKPTRNNKNEPIHELTFREPTGGDINRYGNPVRINQDGDLVFDERKMSMMISSLSGVLLPFVEALDPRDWNSCAYRLRSFFLPDPSAW
jgi:hypothetical protein